MDSLESKRREILSNVIYHGYPIDELDALDTLIIELESKVEKAYQEEQEGLEEEDE